MTMNKFLKNRINSAVCPILLGAAICYSTIYILHEPAALPYTMLSLAAQFLLFLFFDKLKATKALCPLIYTFVCIAVMSYSLRLVFRGAYSGTHSNPIDWFYGEEGVETNQPMYLNALFIGGGFFVASILYYYTQVRYRTLGVMLCTLFPFVLYGKRGDEMPEILITLILTMFFAVVVHNRRLDPAKKREVLGNLKVDKAYIISFAVFISVTGAVAMTVQKPTFRSQLEKNADYFDNFLFNGAGTSGYETLSRSSSTRNGGFGFNDSPLFDLEDDGSKSIYYLRRQVFNDFNGKIWEANAFSFWRESPYSTENPEYLTDDVLNDMSTVISADPSLYERYKKYDLPNLYTIKNLKVYDDDFSSAYLPAPYGTVTDDVARYMLEYSKYPPGGVIYRTTNWGEKTEILNDSFEYMDMDVKFKQFAKDLGISGNGYMTLLNVSRETEAAERLKADYNDALARYTNQTGVSQRLAALARQITDGYYSDYNKAVALEKYFSENGYLYSTEYKPRDTSIDYFVFESKTGYCAAYATAMTLMARAVGLPARYVEGFAAFERTDSTHMIIREGHAHAFVEVYIPGTGWMTFDPTVSDYLDMNSGAGNVNAGFVFYLLFWLSRFFIVIIVALLIIFVVLFDRIREVFLRTLMLFMPVEKRVLMLYANVLWLVKFSTGSDHSAYTVIMLRKYLLETRGIAPEKLLVLFEKTAFGGYTPTKDEFDQAYDEYKNCFRYLRKVPKKKPAQNTA